MRKIRIAQIGIGHDHSSRVFQSMRNQPEIFDIAGYAFTREEEEYVPKQRDIREGYRFMDAFNGVPKRSIDELLNDDSIEAIVIETEEAQLTNYALMAAQKGKHIHMDKAGGFDLAQYRELIRTVKEKDLVFHTGYMYRYNPYIQQLLQSAKNGELGEIISVDAHMCCKHVPEKRQWLEQLPGGMLFFLGCHMIDLVLQLQGEPESILPLSRSTGADGVTAKDFGMAVLEYPHGVSVVKSSAEETGGFVCRKLVVNGTKASVVLQPLEINTENGIYTERRVYTSDDWEDQGAYSKSGFFTRFEGMMRGFAEMVAGERENPWKPEYELQLYQTLLKCCGMA